MNLINKKFLIGLMAVLLAGGFAGCGLSSIATTQPPVTTVTTEATTAAASTTTAATATTTLPALTTTAVTNIGLVLSGTWTTVYEFGQPFDPAGLVVTLVRSDGTESPVGEYTILGFNTASAGLKTVRIRYGGVEASFTIYVKEAVIAADVALEVDLPDKLVYQLGESADWTGLSVSVVKSDGERVDLSAETYAVAGFSSDVIGLVTITVTYDDLAATFPVYVAAPASGGDIALAVTLPAKTVYTEGETLDLTGLAVSLVASGETPIVLSAGQYAVDAPDLSSPGVYEIVVSALGLEYRFTVTVEPDALDLIPYFDDAEGLEGDALLLALRDILESTVHLISYGDVRYVLDETDADPNHAGYLIEFYTGQSRNATWDDGITYNREHVWPQSLLGIDVDNPDVGVGSDIFNLTPADPSINSSRSNKWFSTVTNTYSYLPSRTAIHGDIARILLYMTVMYDYLHLVELNATQNPALYQMGDLSTLLAWHLADPVDDFERNRNEVVYSYQGNRNPFIDHPELVDLIWGN